MKPKLLIFINSLKLGGAERVVSHLLHHLNDDFELHLALYRKEIDYDIPPNIPVFDLQQSLDEQPYAVFLKIPWLSYRLSRYCKKNQIHTSVAFLNRPCYINALMRTLWRFKGSIIMCERTHQTTILESNSWLFRNVSTPLVSFSYKHASLVLVNSYASKQDLIENFHVKTPMQVIYNPIDLEKIKTQAAMPCSFEFEEGKFHFIAVGGFRKEKNLQLLLEAFFIIKNLPVKLIIVGSGVQKKDLEKKVQDLGLQTQVIFTGFDNNPFKYVKRSDCFVLSSYVEGFPNVLLEALACGKPIISTDCKSGPRELLSPGSDLHHQALTSYEVAEFGILTPVNDVTNLASSMKKMYEDKQLRETYESKAFSRAEKFDVSEIIQYFHVAFSGH
jgi:N-acetylgalactosamine-N,N'-diacetylbacillosaminyl-diphospho-undecaprenol 4-alpha-N-acetylgalactosaminyltransferase